MTPAELLNILHCTAARVSRLTITDSWWRLRAWKSKINLYGDYRLRGMNKFFLLRISWGCITSNGTGRNHMFFFQLWNCADRSQINGWSMFLRETNGLGKFEVSYYCNGYDASPPTCTDDLLWSWKVENGRRLLGRDTVFPKFWHGGPILGSSSKSIDVVCQSCLPQSFAECQAQIFMHLAVDHRRVTIV